MKTCCFTGHREVKEPDLLRERIKSAITSLIEQGVTDFYDGGAIGFDQLCGETIIELKNQYSFIKLYLLLPCPPYEQTKYWSITQTEKYNELLGAADDVTILSEHYTSDCMKKRNAMLVEKADCCVCYCGRQRSGTAQTVRMAYSKGIDVINLF